MESKLLAAGLALIVLLLVLLHAWWLLLLLGVTCVIGFALGRRNRKRGA